MADIEKILDGINIPKQLLEKSEKLLKVLFGESFEEIGGIIADQVRLRRFKNQIKIFNRAQEILKEKKINPQKVSLKVLAPLIEYSSYEEEDTLQEMWSKLIVNALSDTQDTLFQQNCISILNKLTSEEAKLLDVLFKLLQQRLDAYNKRNHHRPKSSDEYSVSIFSFGIAKLAKELGYMKNDFYFKISNLVSLGLLKWETDVSVEASKTDDDPNSKDIDVQVYVYNDDEFTFTVIDERFVKICKDL